MREAPSAEQSSPARWIDENHYAQLFQAFRLIPNDPETALVAGLLHADGSFEQSPLFFLPDGTATPSIPGDYAVRVLDTAGQTVSAVTFPVAFEMLVEPTGAEPTDAVPVVVQVPYPDTAATIELVHGDQVLTRIAGTERLLADTIAAIPDFGFAGDVVTRRIALKNKVNAIGHDLAIGNTKGALQKLTQDLRPRIQAWVLDSIVKTDSLQVDKPEALLVIDAMIIRVGNM